MAKLETDQIQERLLQVLAQLPLPRQEEVLKFAMSLRQQELTQRWDAISDEEAAALKAEFADEDIEMTEAALKNYLLCFSKRIKLEIKLFTTPLLLKDYLFFLCVLCASVVR